MYRLPGPSTMSSASAIAASASSEARTSSGVIHTRSIPIVPMTCDWPSTTVPSASWAWRVSGVGDTGQDLATDREDPVHQPDAVLEVAALDRGHPGDQQVAEGVAGQPARLPTVGCREAVLHDLAHQRLGVRQRHDAVADVADRRDPELGPEHARRPAVVGHGHDRGQVAGVLLEPAQERRQAGPTTDGDDPRAAGEEPLLVDQLDQGLVRVARPERVGQDVDDPVRPEQRPGRPRPTPATSPRNSNGRNWRVRIVDQHADDAGRFEVAGDLAQEMGEGDGQQQQPREDDEEPALDPDARGQPAPEVHVRSSSRWKTATGPKSWPRSQAAISSAMTIER